MRVVKVDRGFVVARGVRKVKYFSFWVDHYRVSWTSYRPTAHHFATESEAETAINNVIEREKVRRRERAMENL